MKSLKCLTVFCLVACGTVEEIEVTAPETPIAIGKADTANPRTKGEESLDYPEEDSASNLPSEDENVSDDTDAHNEAETDEYESLADQFDYCGEFELYGDGECQRFCHEPDPDCEGVAEPEPFCSGALIEEDGECTIACMELDPDCAEPEVEDSEWEVDEGILGVCSRFSEPDLVQDLAEAICIEAESRPTAYQGCIDACLDAFYDGQ